MHGPLKLGGRLVVLFPTCSKWDDAKNTLPSHKGFKLISHSINPLPGKMQMHMLCDEKIVIS